MEKTKVIAIVGPTAVGKTDVSIEVAKKLNGEIINGDSMQIYRTLDIGTAKISPSEMNGIPHHLLDIKNPDESFSVAEFQQLVREKINEINTRGKLPVLVGGTGLYVQAVLFDYQFAGEGKNEEIRTSLEEEAEKKGIMSLYDRLSAIDPKTAETIHPNNQRRVIRALEVYYSTGKTPAEWQAAQKKESVYDHHVIGLTMEREYLYKRINERVDLMLSQGLLEEVQALHDSGLRNVQSIQAIGYKELYSYLDGEITLACAIEQLKQNSRRYAKKQLTWFRNKMDIEWFDLTQGTIEKKQKILRFLAGK
ncbi:tRNA (adenosine(37)-N6)-dimethylallyltransferase MiaA [Jeotgalibacillus proteolyticus]|uniref:tRNA dimethylallyltransferase n=1 Tax=Jeotgalibacillus proteolyticus TaxID=2082395 RepID=A0A2S5GG31_9BACL|nr:tRNA (adenosine(37)-N6)-dimethylallyltransferase MiaA [Jeotgalibacillus proteolyticus]PPA71977.1 tRNA (adenosine(37)-N6)-dimethylallyltransferase MiaA [Jeotgalibacillus proteolyticus]